MVSDGILLPQVLSHPLRITELEVRLTPRFFRRHAPGHVFGDLLRQISIDFLE